MADGLGKLLGTAPTVPNVLDYAQIKRFEEPFAGGRYLRFVLLGVCCLLYWRAYGGALLLWWFAGLMAAQLLHYAALRSLPDAGPRQLMWRILVTQALGSAVFCLPGLYLWTLDTPDARIFSLLFLVAGALNAITLRSHLREPLWIDLGLQSFTVLARVGWVLWQAPGAAESWALVVALMALHLFFVKAVCDLRGTRVQLQARLAEQTERDRQRALTQFTGGVAHDFNNLLTVVLGNMELARLSEAPGERDALMNEAELAARRGAELTNQLLTLSRKAHLSPVSERPERLLGPVHEIAQGLVGPGHRLRLALAPDLPAVFVDPAKFQAALLELICNARDAMPEGGEIVLSAQTAPQQDGGGAVRFGVADSGSGIPGHMLKTVFEPYFTTKPRGRGSGLGLPMVRGFIEQSDGELLLESVNGAGTQVWIDLPARPENLSAPPPGSGRGRDRV
ncbi:ATP-binding protein [Salipiger sp. P9]|uniref:sensor histidine kinase n=1 Tax=Salipiger pentaromativorans TaxID=2943193 RepID=UPI002157C15B|nr:ATP-binding protein [Salipiger pentaromativorans]MCR8546312.1 ATP-binding protein [Salipiger pentaromativorans]